jgi:hypothetical protein
MPIEEGALDLWLKKIEEPQPEPCKGQIYRCERTSYVGSGGDVNFKIRFRPLKRMSCPGCEFCGWVDDDLHERLNEFYYKFDPGSHPIIHDNCEHGKLYELKITGVSTDWESGVVDDYDLTFVEVKDEHQTSNSNP